MFVNLNIPSFGELLSKFVFSFKKKKYEFRQPITKWYCNVCYTVILKIWAWWSDILNNYLLYICLYVLGLILFF